MTSIARTSAHILELQAWVSNPAIQELISANKPGESHIALYANEQAIGRLEAAVPSDGCCIDSDGNSTNCKATQILRFKLFINQQGGIMPRDPKEIASWSSSLKTGVSPEEAQNLFSTEQAAEIASKKEPILKNVDFHVRAALNMRTSRLHMIFSRITDDWILEFIKASGIDTSRRPYRIGFTFGRDGNYKFTAQSGGKEQRLTTWHPMSPVMRDDVNDIYAALGEKVRTLTFRTEWLADESDELIFKLRSNAMDREAWQIWRALLPSDPQGPDVKSGLSDLDKSYTHDGDIYLLAGQTLELKPASMAPECTTKAKPLDEADVRLLKEVQCFALARTTVRSTPEKSSFWSGGGSRATYRISMHGSNFSTIDPDELRSSTIDLVTGLVSKVVVASTEGQHVAISMQPESEAIPMEDHEQGNLRQLLSTYQLVAEERGTLFDALATFSANSQATDQDNPF